jgi:hypothetical protein
MFPQIQREKILTNLTRRKFIRIHEIKTLSGRSPVEFLFGLQSEILFNCGWIVQQTVVS